MTDIDLKKLENFLEIFFIPDEIMKELSQIFEDYAEFKEMNEYNRSVIAYQRKTVEQVSKKNKQLEAQLNELKASYEDMLAENERLNDIKNEVIERNETLLEYVELFKIQIKSEVKKNYQLSESLEKISAENKKNLSKVQQLTGENTTLTDLLLKAEQKCEELNDQIQYEFERGFKAALYQYRRKK